MISGLGQCFDLDDVEIATPLALDELVSKTDPAGALVRAFLDSDIRFPN